MSRPQLLINVRYAPISHWSFQSSICSPRDTRFTLLSLIVFSGACAVFISYTTSWCIRATSSTTYSMVGALNKLPLALSGIVFFGDALTATSGSSIFLGFVAGWVMGHLKRGRKQMFLPCFSHNSLFDITDWYTRWPRIDKVKKTKRRRIPSWLVWKQACQQVQMDEMRPLFPCITWMARKSATIRIASFFFSFLFFSMSISSFLFTFNERDHTCTVSSSPLR